MVVLVVVATRPATKRTLRQLRTWPVPRWTFTAGLAGALIATVGALAVETIGVAIFSIAFFAGLIACGLLVDLAGLGPGGKRPISTPRVLASVLAVAAVFVTQIGRPVGEFAPALVALVVASGAAVAFQSAFNARIADAIGDAVAATAVNVAVGLIALAATTGLVLLTREQAAARWPADPGLYLGGVLGVTIVLSLAIATRTLGVLRAMLGMLAAQLVTAFIVDWTVQRTLPTPGVYVGAVLIAVAVAGAGRTAPSRPVVP